MKFRHLIAAALALVSLSAAGLSFAQSTYIENLPLTSSMTGAEKLVCTQGTGASSSHNCPVGQLRDNILADAATAEMVRDTAAAFAVGGTGISITHNDAANTLTFAYTGGGGGGGPSTNLGWVSGKWYGPRRTSSGTVVASADLFTAVPIFFSADATVASLGVRVTALVASTNGVACVYANSSGRPGALEYAPAAPFSTAAVANVEAAFSSAPTITAGWHWFATHFNGAPTVQATGITDQYLSGIIGGAAMADALNASNQVNGVTGTATYTGTCPSTFGTATERTIATPLVAFKIN